jgi:hypothetical protein
MIPSLLKENLFESVQQFADQLLGGFLSKEGSNKKIPERLDRLIYHLLKAERGMLARAPDYAYFFTNPAFGSTNGPTW